MKLMIASDLHGSSYYVNQLLDRFREEAPRRLVLLGDLLYHGPRNELPRDYDTRAVAEALNALNPGPLCVRGNCDGEVDQMVLRFPVLTETALLWADGRSLYLSHGHRLGELSPLLSPGDVLLFGHTHVPEFRQEKGTYYVNPGSVSLPKDGSCHSYLLWDEGRLLWKDVESGRVWKEERL